MPGNMTDGARRKLAARVAKAYGWNTAMSPGFANFTLSGRTYRVVRVGGKAYVRPDGLRDRYTSTKTPAAKRAPGTVWRSSDLMGRDCYGNQRGLDLQKIFK